MRKFYEYIPQNFFMAFQVYSVEYYNITWQLKITQNIYQYTMIQTCKIKENVKTTIVTYY